MLHAFVRYHRIARFQAAGGATVFLIPAFAACNEQDLVAVGVNVPVVAAGGFKADVVNGCRCVGRGSQARQITLSDKDIGVPFVFFAKRKNAVFDLLFAVLGVHFYAPCLPYTSFAKLNADHAFGQPT